MTKKIEIEVIDEVKELYESLEDKKKAKLSIRIMQIILEDFYD